MTTLPSGTVIVRFTDVAGSTERWEQDRAAMSATQTRWDRSTALPAASDAPNMLRPEETIHEHPSFAGHAFHEDSSRRNDRVGPGPALVDQRALAPTMQRR